MCSDRILRRPFAGVLLAGLVLALATGCGMTVDAFEKDVAIPGQQWPGAFRPDIPFEISDTTALYNVFIVIRHTDKYAYNNIFLRVAVLEPGDKTPRSADYDLRLATNDKGWIGSAMDDIYETRVLIQPRTRFPRAGAYHISLEQLMREDPLRHVLNVGLRVEKIQP